MRPLRPHELSIAIASVALFISLLFATWSVVVDGAPWESNDTEIVVAATPAPPSRCELLTQQAADARTEAGAITINRLGRQEGCWE